jgi:hypothetical protein
MFRNPAAALKARRPQIYRLHLRRPDFDVEGAAQTIIKPEPVTIIKRRTRQPRLGRRVEKLDRFFG